MLVVTFRRLINLDGVKNVYATPKSELSGDPCVVFVLEYGKHIDRRIEVSFPEYEIAKKHFEKLCEAIVAGVNFYDMRWRNDEIR